MDNAQIDLKKVLGVENNNEDIDAFLSKLSAKEKAELVNKLIGQSNLMVVLGGSNVTTSEVVIQIHTNSGLDASDLLKAIANRIVKPDEGKDEKNN
ncbi:MAG: hypothetical protein ACRC11_14580 [Xenococcaceae cyanobacterium]